MHCSVYKGRNVPDTYLFISTRGDLDAVPAAVLERFGALEHVMDLVLTPGRRLARTDSRTLLRALLQNGCYVQLPPRDEQ